MTQRTHDLAAVASVSYYFLSHIPTELNWESLIGMGVATLLGGITPDIDNIASPAWKHKLLPWESEATRTFLEGHRHLSHSLIGLVLFTTMLHLFLFFLRLPNLHIDPVVTAFLLGYASHLVMDSLTKEGVPWFYPLPFKLGFPPFKVLRVKTGSWVERLVVFPALLIGTIWMYYEYRTNIFIFIDGVF